jgi:hypothetical protein
MATTGRESMPPAMTAPAPPTGRKKSRSRAWVWFFVCLAVLAAVAVAVPLFYNLSLQLTPGQLAAAKAKWESNKPRDYDLGYEEKLTRNGETETYEWKVEVRDGRVVGVTCNGRPLLPDPDVGLAAGLGAVVRYGAAFQGLSVEGKFARIEADLEKDVAEGQRRNYMMAVFDDRDGRPLRYIRRVKATGDRLEWNLRLTRPGEE